MPRSFVITSTSQTASPDPKGCGEISFTVTNSASKPVRGEARPLPLGATKAEWLGHAGEKERNFGPNESHQFTVRIQLPPGSQAGKYSFRLNMVAVQNPEEDFTEGPEVSYEAKATESAPAPKPFPIWIIFVILGLVVVAGAVAVVLLLPKKIAVPDVTQKPILEASNALVAAKFAVEIKEDVTRTNGAGTVFAQSPAAGGKAKAGAKIELTVEGQPVTVAVPDVLGMPVGKVKSIFDAKDLKHSIGEERITQKNPPPAGTIVEVTPKVGALVDLGSTVKVTVEAPSVEVPDVRGGLQLSVAMNRLNDAKLSPGRTEQQVTTDASRVNMVIGQEPAPGIRVKPDDKVNLKIGVLRVFNPRDWSVYMNTNAILKTTPFIKRQLVR